jgi:hypothetical protein
MNILPIEFRVLGGMWCGDVVALNGSVSPWQTLDIELAHGSRIDLHAQALT